MAAFNATDLSNAIVSLYEKRLLVRAQPHLPHGRWGQHAEYTGHNIYSMRRYAQLSAATTALSEGTTPAETSTANPTLVTITPAAYGSWMGFTDRHELTSYDPVIGTMSALLGDQAGLTIDTLCRNTLTGTGATIDYSGGATTRLTIDRQNDKIAYVDWVQNYVELLAANARQINGKYICIIHPYTLEAFMTDSTFVTLFTRAGGNAMVNGFMGTIFDCDVYISSNSRVYAGGGQNAEDVYTMVFIGEDGYGTAGFSGRVFDYGFDGYAADSGAGGLTGQDKSPLSMIVNGLGETGFDPLKQRGTVGWLAYHGDVVLNAAFIRTLEHVNSF